MNIFLYRQRYTQTQNSGLNTKVLSLFLFALCVWCTPTVGVTQTQYPRDNSYTAQATLLKEQKRHSNISLASRTIPSNIIAWKDQPYKTLDKRTLTLDVYSLKNAKKPLASILLVHGGGWRSGDKNMLTPLALGLAQQGFTVASVSYRLSPEALFPAAFYDVSDALRWFKQHGHRYNGNTDFIAIGGTSAGGQLASLVAYSNGVLMDDKNLQSAPKQNTVTVQALLNIDGLMDFTSEEALPFENDPKRKVTSASAWLGGRYEDVPSTWKRASAYFYTSKNSPPTLFLNSAHARFHAGRDATIEKLNAYERKNKTITLPNTPHTFWLFEQWLPQAVTHSADFLRDVIAEEAK